MQSGKIESKALNESAETYVLALRAARQLDLASRGKNFSSDEINAFVERLQVDSDIPPSVEKVRSLAPGDIGVMQRALLAYGGDEPTTIEDLAQNLENLFGEIRQPLDKLDKEHIDRLIAFCITLHDEMLSHRRAYQESRKLRSQYRV